MIRIFKIKTPAKINIGLRILSKRQDGYHNIETIFYPVKIYDHIEITIDTLNNMGKLNKIFRNRNKAGIAVKMEPDLKLKQEDNICFKAAKAYLDALEKTDKVNVAINIKKNIPSGAGLGGGSSDAAAVLKELHNRLRGRSKVSLNKIASSIGSDVPFFLNSYKSYACGRGEKLKSLPKFVLRGKLLIVNPGINVPTAWAYKSLKIYSLKKPILKSINIFRLEDKDKYVNDFEKVVFKKYPAIEKIKEQMYKFGAALSLMSGSGSTVFGIFKSKADMESAQKYFIKKKYKTFTS